jgi:DNA ligase-1
MPHPAEQATLTVLEVHAAFDRITASAGSGAQARKRAELHELLRRATAAEQHFVAALVGGELRQGALDGLMLDAVAKATGVPAQLVRRAAMLRGATGPVAAAALSEGEAGLDRFRLEVGRPVRPMLAATAPDVGEAIRKATGDSAGAAVAVEWKLDGIRVQAHRRGDDVRVFTRSLDDITGRVPEVVRAVSGLPVSAAVLDGEAIALNDRGAPLPFQETAARTASQPEPAGTARGVPLSTYFFDVLHLDGDDLLDAPAHERLARLDRVVPPKLRVPRLVTALSEEASAFSAAAVRQGHEGVVVKALGAPYEAGRRGSAWVKVKPRHTLDLVVLAAEWGHGRRKGWLSNLHLGAREPDSGGFVMLGKTFKGLTDAMLDWQTERLLALATNRESYVVHVRPELVVEVAFDGVQTSSRYPGGMALRFARVLRYREDKSAAEADTVATVRMIHDRSAG